MIKGPRRRQAKDEDSPGQCGMFLQMPLSPFYCSGTLENDETMTRSIWQDELQIPQPRRAPANVLSRITTSLRQVIGRTTNSSQTRASLGLTMLWTDDSGPSWIYIGSPASVQRAR